MDSEVLKSCPPERLVPQGTELPAPSSGRAFPLRAAAFLACVWILSLGYLGFYLKRNWVPHDEGTYAQSAERVLQGELPHRDFIDSYTGGLTFLNALAFRVFGVNLASLRIALFILFATWVPCLFYIASRSVSTSTAAAITFLCVAWSVPNYPAAVPSWYNLFFATFGIAALLRYIEASARRWLIVAGFCGGLSIVVKITGLYFVFAVFLFLIFREQIHARSDNVSSAFKNRVYGAFVTIGLALFLASLIRLVYRIQGMRGLVFFVMPSSFLVGLLVYREFVEPRGPDRHRFADIISVVTSFGAAVAVPILVLLIPYGFSHSTGALWHDIFDGTDKQLLFSATAAPNPIAILVLFPIGLFIFLALVSGRQDRLLCGTFLSLYFAAILWASSHNQLIFTLGWLSMASVIPAITFAGVLSLAHPRILKRLGIHRQQQIMLLIGVMGLVSLVQFPFSTPVYFCYVAPLAILAATFLAGSIERPPRLALGSLVGFYVLFAVLWLTPRFNLKPLDEVSPGMKTQRLTLARAGNLLVDSSDAKLYEMLIPSIQSHAEGDFIYAAPDCPEVYFLAGLKNPTRTIFEFRDDSAGRTDKILLTLKSHEVNVVAINRKPRFSHTLEPGLVEALDKLYPNSEEVGHFQLRWKADTPKAELK